MSSVGSSGSHLTEVAHRSSTNPSHYSLQSAGASRAQERLSTRSMGGMVSAITAVFCGSNRNRHSTDSLTCDTKVAENGYHKESRESKQYQPNTTARSLKPEDFTLLDSSMSCDSSYRTAAGSISELANGLNLSVAADTRPPLDIPYMDESTNSSSTSTPRDMLTFDREVIMISDGEYSADEDQHGEPTDHSDMEEIERNSDTEDEDVERHICHTDCEHSEGEELEYDSGEEVEDESEVNSDDQLLSDSEGEPEVGDTEESEYDSEEGIDANSEVDEEEAIEISEEEDSWDDEEPSEEEDLVNGECDSNCESDCDGDHHECSSECGCGQHESDEDDESETQIAEKNTRESLQTVENGIYGHKPLPLPRRSLRAVSPSNTSRNLLTDTSNVVPQAIERNNNRLQRNHSQRLPRSDTDMLGELKTAIDARIRRSASCRETAIDYRKRFAQVPSADNCISEHLTKLDIKERELRRKERRSRLRTLELKREQCLAEVRDGTEENVAHRVYS